MLQTCKTQSDILHPGGYTIHHPDQEDLRLTSAELLQVFSQKLSADGRFWDWLAAIDFNEVGYVIAGLFVLTWALALSAWRFGRIEERWTAGLRPPEDAA